MNVSPEIVVFFFQFTHENKDKPLRCLKTPEPFAHDGALIALSGKMKSRMLMFVRTLSEY